MDIRGNSKCRLIASSFASAFIAADELAHAQAGETVWASIPQLKSKIDGSISSLQAHLGNEASISLGVGLGRIWQGEDTRDMILINSGAEMIQEVILREGLIAIAEECGKKEQ